MEVLVTFDSSSNHPHLKHVREALDREGEEGKYTNIGGIYYTDTADGVRARLDQILGGLPRIFQGLPIISVHIKDIGVKPGPTMGYFKLAQAEGWVKSESSSIWRKADPNGWVLEVAAPTLDQAKQLYIEMHQSNARPARAWGDAQKLPAEGASPLDTLSPFASEQHKTDVAIQHLKRKLAQGELTMNELVAALHQSNV